LLPVGGVVELASRAFQVHPFDALLIIEDLVSELDTFRLDLQTPFLVKALAGELLHRLGYQWWRSGSVRGERELGQTRALDEGQVINIVDGLIRSMNLNEKLKVSNVDWINDVFNLRQQILFCGSSPIKIYRLPGVSNQFRVERVYS
jgi:hypothetical protein